MTYFQGDSQVIDDLVVTSDRPVLTPEDRQFLLLTSILETLTDKLCGVVAPDLDVPLRELRRRCPILEPLDRNGNEYRIPPAIRETLVAELKQADSPERLQARHLKAAEVLATEMRRDRTLSTSPKFDKAIDHYFFSGNPPKAADLLGERVGENAKAVSPAGLTRFEHTELDNYAPHILTIGIVQGHDSNFAAVERAIIRLQAIDQTGQRPDGSLNLEKAVQQLESILPESSTSKKELRIRHALETSQDTTGAHYLGQRYQAAHFSYFLNKNDDALTLTNEVLRGHRSVGRSHYTDKAATILAVLLQGVIASDEGDQQAALESLAHGEALITEYQLPAIIRVVMDLVDLTQAIVGGHQTEVRLQQLHRLANDVDDVDLSVHARTEIVRLQDQTYDRDGAMATLVKLESFCEGREVTPLLAGRIRSLRASFSPPDTVLKPHQYLTERERAVLFLLVNSSLTQLDIADKLELSINTVKSHLRSIHQKFGVTTRNETIEFATNAGLLTTVLPWNTTHPAEVSKQ